LLAITGLLGIGYEVLVVRVLSQVTENTVYTFALLLAVYLVGTALGAAAYHRWLTHRSASSDPRDSLFTLLAAACLLGTLGLAGAQSIKGIVLQISAPSLAAALGAEIVLATIAFLLPTLAMGALFSHLATAARAAGVSFASALGVNTLGAAIAPMLFGVLLVPAVGAKLSLLLVATGYLALTVHRAIGRMTAASGVLALAIGAAALWAPTLAIVDIPEGGRLVSYAEGAMGTVSVVEDADGVARLHINNRQQEGSSATLLADARQAILPVLLHPTPRRALFLGMGTGVTSFSAAEDASLRVDVVELLPEVIEASEYFTRPFNDSGAKERLHAMSADARRFVRTASERYDVIISDNFHPARSGSGSLYTVEHFQAVRERLATDGLFCQWLPLHQLDLETLRSIVRAFLEIYPQGWALLATNSLETPVLGLVARADGKPFALSQVRARLSQAALPRSPAEFGLNDELALLGSFIAGPQALASFAGDAPLNTDDRPIVAYRAPRITYSPDSLPRDRLITLLRSVQIKPDELLAVDDDTALAQRLSAYWAARNEFIEAGRDVQPTPDVQRMLAQVREPLLAVLRTSADFRPAYDPLLQMAAALSSIDPNAARDLLMDLQQAQPSRPEAAELLRAARP
jgi:spermidine synthase